MPRPLLRRLLVALALVAAAPAAQAQRVPAVPPADLSRLDPASFTDDELYLPYYLQHFHRVANAVPLAGPRRGFIDLSVWRAERDNEPYNARIMENITSLAFFYATDRPWNPYRGHPALRARLEAALDFWVRSQNADGRFSEYRYGNWSLAPTAFATKFMAETLRLLKDGPPIDPALHRRVIAAQRRAIEAVLTRDDLYQHGRSYSNQFGNVWAGALGFLADYPDPALRQRVLERYHQSQPDHQSPVGFFYERDGPDWGYNLGTHHSNVHMAWHFARSTPLADALVEETRRWYDWFSYNAVPEPDGSGFTMNRAIETRQRHPFVVLSGQDVAGGGFPLAEQVELARLLVPSREEVAEQQRQQRARLAAGWPAVDSLRLGEFSAFSPYAFLHREQAQWYPTAQQKREAMRKLPFLARDRFSHQRMDTRVPSVFTFVRRPAYYAAFTSGPTATAQQRFGLGLLWSPEGGTYLQSQTGATNAAWGTRSAADTVPHEATGFAAEWTVGGQAHTPRAGNHDLPAGELSARYPLRERGRKTVAFGDAGIRVAVQHPGDFHEQIPLLLLPGDQLRTVPGRIELRRGATGLTLRFEPAASVTVGRTAEEIGAKRLVVLAIPATDSLQYSISLGGR